MPNISHDSLLTIVPVGSAVANDWTTTLRRSDDVGYRTDRTVNPSEAEWAVDVVTRGAPNMYPGEAKAVGLLAEIAARFTGNETLHVARGAPVFEVTMPPQVSLADIEAVNADWATVARRIASTQPGQADPAPTHLNFEEAKRAVDDRTLTTGERAVVGHILRDFFIGRANGATSAPVKVEALVDTEHALRVNLERNVNDISVGSSAVSYRLSNAALELEAPAGTMVLVELNGSGRRASRKVSESIHTVPANGKVRVAARGRRAFVYFIRPGAAGELPTLMRRACLDLPGDHADSAPI